MCGFTAVVGNIDHLMDSLKSMSFRGLWGHNSYYSEKKIHIAHTRLPIVDFTAEGNQPARINDQIGFLVGEIFNFKEFSNSTSDTKAALEVFIKKGLNGFHQFDGFWSFVTIYQDKLLAATDYLSQKPIYYRTDMKAIASEPKALLAYGKANFDELFFSNVRKWGYDPTGRTAWEQIKQLPAGHYWLDGEIKPYWDWNKIDSGSIRGTLTQATKNRLLGGREIACLLSGGLDSSIVYMLSKELGANLKAFHVANEEAEFAKLIAPDIQELSLNLIPYTTAIKNHQSPIDLGSVLPQAILAEAIAEQGFHVCLTGDGADELFGGYKRTMSYDSQHSDVFMELPYYHLPKLDRLMMKETIELRTPFLAPSVIKTALELPYKERINKLALKKAFDYLLPSSILLRSKKALKTKSIRTNETQQRELTIQLFKEIYS